MQSPAEAATPGSPSPSTFSQVVFIDIPHSYPPSTAVTCCYTLISTFQPNPRDWVGVFKVGWSSTKDYHTFVWVEPCLDVVGQQSVMSQAVFKDYYLPKDEVEFYQFCYIDSTGQVRGASTPFCFRNPVEHSIESNLDDDLLVITTQEQVEQSVREKAELQREMKQIMEENETLKTALQKKEQEAASWKGQNEEKEKEKRGLVEELDQIKEQNVKLTSTLQQQLQESDRLKEELLTQKVKQMEIQQQNASEEAKTAGGSSSLDGASKQNETHAEDKYNRALMKINQLKQERSELRGRVEAQCEELSTLNAKIREQQRELFSLTDSIQIMKVDMKSSEKDKERLAAELQTLQSLTQNMDEVKRENRELCRQLSEQNVPQNSSHDEDLKAQCQTLCSQLQDAQAKLEVERGESRNARARMDFLGGELLQVREQLNSLASSRDVAQKRSNKLEMQLREAHEVIADKDSAIAEKEHMITLVSQEKEELVRHNQSLTGELEEQRRVYATLRAAAPPADALHVQPDTTSSTYEIPDHAENVYENIDDAAAEEEQALVCRHCQERFPLITRQELEQHEQSHRVCPFCTMICDHMEQSVFEDHVYGHEL